MTNAPSPPSPPSPPAHRHQHRRGGHTEESAGQAAGPEIDHQLVPHHPVDRLLRDRSGAGRPGTSAARQVRGGELQVQVRLRYSDRDAHQTTVGHRTGLHAERRHATVRHEHDADQLRGRPAVALQDRSGRLLLWLQRWGVNWVANGELLALSCRKVNRILTFSSLSNDSSISLWHLESLNDRLISLDQSSHLDHGPHFDHVTPSKRIRLEFDRHPAHTGIQLTPSTHQFDTSNPFEHRRMLGRRESDRDLELPGEETEEEDRLRSRSDHSAGNNRPVHGGRRGVQVERDRGGDRGREAPFRAVERERDRAASDRDQREGLERLGADLKVFFIPQMLVYTNRWLCETMSEE